MSKCKTCVREWCDLSSGQCAVCLVAERDTLQARVAELEGHNLEYALHEQKLQEAITRIDTLSRYDNHPRSRSARDAAIKDAVELGEGK